MSLPVKLWPGSDNNLSNPAKTILRNRGIDDYKEYMNLSDKALYRYLERHPEIEEIVFCYDNDTEGKDTKESKKKKGFFK